MKLRPLLLTAAAKNGSTYYCRSHSMSKEIKDLGAVSAISQGPKWE